MDSVPIPLWSIGILLIVVGPFAVQRLADLWAAAVERRTDEALSAMTAGAKGTALTQRDSGQLDSTQQDGPQRDSTQQDGPQRDSTQHDGTRTDDERRSH